MGGAANGSANMGDGFGAMVTTSEDSSGGMASGFAGLYSAASSSSDQALELDWPATRKLILAGVQGLNAGFIEVVNEYAP